MDCWGHWIAGGMHQFSSSEKQVCVSVDFLSSSSGAPRAAVVAGECRLGFLVGDLANLKSPTERQRGKKNHHNREEGLK
jgi:hypothetical protein